MAKKATDRLPWEREYNFHERRQLAESKRAVIYVCIPSRKDIPVWYEVKVKDGAVMYFKNRGSATKSFNKE